MNQSLGRLNDLAAADAAAEFLKCCGSPVWAHAMSAARPFHSLDEVLARADQIWWSLNQADWLEAFRAHPKTGEKKAAAAQSTEAQKWSAQEQSSITEASAQTLFELAERNVEYE